MCLCTMTRKTRIQGKICAFVPLLSIVAFCRCGWACSRVLIFFPGDEGGPGQYVEGAVQFSCFVRLSREGGAVCCQQTSHILRPAPLLSLMCVCHSLRVGHKLNRMDIDDKTRLTLGTTARAQPTSRRHWIDT